MQRCSTLALGGLLAVVSLSSPCFGREYWNGTREGMSRAELTRLFGAHLKPYAEMGQISESIYTLDAPQSFCGGDFQLIFGFDPSKPQRGLVWESLELAKATNSDGRIGDCVLRKYTVRYGRPKKSNGGFDLSGQRTAATDSAVSRRYPSCAARPAGSPGRCTPSVLPWAAGAP